MEDACFNLNVESISQYAVTTLPAISSNVLISSWYAQEHVRQLQLEQQKLASAAEQDRAAAQSQVNRTNSDMQEVRQQVATLQQALADGNNAPALASQVNSTAICFWP